MHLRKTNVSRSWLRRAGKVLPCAVLLALTATASARDIFVDNVAGDDRHAGAAARSTSEGTGPCRTITRALRSAQQGDRIVLANTGKPYRESISLVGGRLSGYTRQPFILEGNGAVLDGSQPVPERAWQYVKDDIFRYQPRSMTYQQLFLDDVPLERVAVPDDAEQLPPLEPLQWCMFKRAMYLRVEKDHLPQSYRLTQVGKPVGITLYGVRRVVIRDLTVQGYRLDGINAHDGAFDCEIINVTARGNGRSGISVGGASQVRIDQCLVGNNGMAQVRTEGYCHVEIDQSEVIGNTAPAIMMDGGEVQVDGKPFEGA